MIYDPSSLGVKLYLLGNWTQKIGYLSNLENISRDRLVARTLGGGVHCLLWFRGNPDSNSCHGSRHPIKGDDETERPFSNVSLHLSFKTLSVKQNHKRKPMK